MRRTAMKSTIAGALILSLSVASLAAAGTASGSKVSWRKVQQLSPGTTITVTAPGASPRSCYVLAADDTTLRVLSISDLGLAPDTMKVLQQAAAGHPAWFLVVEPRAAVELDKEVVLRSSGLFVAGQRVADYDRVVQTIPRADVETGVVFLTDAPLKAEMERSTKITLAAGLSLAACLALYMFLKARFEY
jgi:hypothetical protein